MIQKLRNFIQQRSKREQILLGMMLVLVLFLTLYYSFASESTQGSTGESAPSLLPQTPSLQGAGNEATQDKEDAFLYAPILDAQSAPSLLMPDISGAPSNLFTTLSFIGAIKAAQSQGLRSFDTPASWSRYLDETTKRMGIAATITYDEAQSAYLIEYTAAPSSTAIKLIQELVRSGFFLVSATLESNQSGRIVFKN